MLKDDQTYFKILKILWCEHRKIFKVWLAIFQDYVIKD